MIKLRVCQVSYVKFVVTTLNLKVEGIGLLLALLKNAEEKINRP